MTVFEEKSVFKAILRLGLPAMLAQLATLIYNTADTYFVSLTKSPDQIAAVTLSTPILLIVMSVACIFGMGSSSVIARLLGENNKEDSKLCFKFSTWAVVLAGLIIAVIGLICVEPIAKAIGTDENNFIYTCDYLKYIFIGAPFIMLSTGYSHSFRSVALVKEATSGVIIGNVLNIILDYIFIVPLKMGTAGAALATSLGYVASSAYYLFCIFKEEHKGNETISLSIKGLSQSKRIAPGVIKIGIPGALITVMLSVSNITLNSHVALYGSNAVACYGIAYKISLFMVLLSVGLAQGIAPLFGFCYGAKQKDRLHKAVYLGGLFDILMGVFFTVIFIFFGKQLCGIFLEEKELIEKAASFLWVIGLSAPMLGVINIVTSYFQALGKAINSMIITMLRNVILFIPGVMLMNYLFKLPGVIATQPTVETIMAVVSIVLYISNQKKEVL
ncbi:MAG: MATE family efflux transporter [Erysipelotrichaceae bacterium]|nr:MATE family efflux transporter [Erysipelotrichaceae bacterium]